MIRKSAAVVLLACLFGLMLPVPAGRADIAPPAPPMGSGIAPGAETTQVRMESETVLIEVAANPYGDPARAVVKANFVMRNLGSQDETMQARFPLNVLYGALPVPDTCAYPQAAPEIQDFQVWVDGQRAPVTETLVRVKDDYQMQPEKDVRCWANFPVRFPAGQVVTVEVQYSVAGYHGQGIDGLVNFPYVLVSGAGWQGTIGRAEIILRAPFELTNLTLAESFPPAHAVEERELRWVYEDFEPEGNVSATIVNPGLWSRVEREQAAIARDRSDGEAWGRLGRWYKEANRLRRGWRWDAGGPELYALSRDAYSQAVALKPNDADWHAGFADLLCWSVFYDHPSGDYAEARDDLVRCADEVRRALEINPNQALAKQLLQDLSTQTGWRPGEAAAVDLSGARPVYTVLTTTPTVRPTDIPIPTATNTPEASATAAATETATEAAATATYASTATAPATRTPEAAAAQQEVAEEELPENENRPAGRGLCGTALLPLIGTGLAVWRGKWLNHIR